MHWEKSVQDMRNDLHRLEEFDTVSPFSRTFYQLICDWIEECGPISARLQEAYAKFLSIEVKRHQSVCDSGDKSRVPIIEWISVRYRAEPALRSLVQQLEAIPSDVTRQESLRQLVLAECYHEFGEDEKVIGALRAAIATGSDHPVVHFGLGYHLYMLSLKRHSRYDPVSNRYTIEYWCGFQRLCEQAIESFKTGFSDSPFDAQLHWWIGCVQESLGKMGEARDAYGKAKEIDPSGLGVEAESRLASMPQPILDADSPEEAERLSQLPPISNEELAKVTRLLKKARNISDFMPGKSPQS